MVVSIDALYRLPPCDRELKILRVEQDFLLLAKPHGLLSVPGRHPENRDSVISRLLSDYPSASVVHRLDFDTSGLMVVPLNKPALSNISKQFQARTVTKHYTAIVVGLVEQDQGSIDLPIGEDDGLKYKICSDRGKPSLTHYQVLTRDEKTQTTRLRLHPITGRSHQLRLHLSAIGHPIVGCVFYGGFSQSGGRSEVSRLLLQATDLQFQHPSTGEKVFCEYLPEF